MKIYIIAYENFDSWLTKKNLDKEVKDLSDEEFIAICNEYQEGWHFDSWDEFIDAFNLDSPYAPVPSSHYIRVVEEKKAKKFKLNIIFGEEAADEAADYGYKKTAKKNKSGETRWFCQRIRVRLRKRPGYRYPDAQRCRRVVRHILGKRRVNR